jgi:predicted TIM-barrel fold metal-dependent hydrolase
MDDALYRGPIVDAHIHLWDLSLRRHPWLDPSDAHPLGDLGPIRRDYLPPDYRADAAGQNVVAAVHVEAGWDPATPLEETRWLESLDKPDGVPNRYVAAVALEAAGAEAAVAAQAAYHRVVGVRARLSWHADPAKRFAARADLMQDARWLAGVRAVGRHGLHLEAMIYPGQADEFARVAAAFPDQTFIVNHCANPVDRDAAGIERWRAALRRLAAEPNVMLKISNVGAYVSAPTRAEVREVALRCIDAFGAARSMFASDYPPARLHTSFGEIFEAFRHAVQSFAPAEQAALFHDNAARCYRIGGSAEARLEGRRATAKPAGIEFED